MSLNKYNNLAAATKDLMNRNFVAHLKLIEVGMVDLNTQKIYRPNDLKIVELHRFSSKNEKSKNSVIFALECADKTKGITITTPNDLYYLNLVKFLDKVRIKEKPSTT